MQIWFNIFNSSVNFWFNFWFNFYSISNSISIQFLTQFLFNFWFFFYFYIMSNHFNAACIQALTLFSQRFSSLNIKKATDILIFTLVKLMTKIKSCDYNLDSKTLILLKYMKNASWADWSSILLEMKKLLIELVTKNWFKWEISVNKLTSQLQATVTLITIHWILKEYKFHKIKSIYKSDLSLVAKKACFEFAWTHRH